MYRWLSTKVVKMTRELVEAVANGPAFKGDRPYKERRGAELADRLALRKFFPPRWSFCTVKGKRWRTNGQHSSGELKKLHGHFNGVMCAIIDEFEGDTMDDVATLYAQHDTLWGVRPDREVIHARTALYREYADLTPAESARVAAGIVFTFTKVEGSKKKFSPEARGDLMPEHKDFGFWMTEFCGTRVFCRPCVVGAIFRTYGVVGAASDAKHFWRWVRDNNHKTPGHPSHTLSGYLLGLTPTRPQTWRAIHSKCIHAWNAYRRKTTTNLQYHKEAPIPTPI